MSKAVLFQRIQFRISMQFKCKYGLIGKKNSTSSYSVQSNNSVQHKYAVLFNPLIGPHQVQPRRTRVELGAMAMKGTLHSLKPRHHRNLTIRLFSVISGHSLGSLTRPSGTHVSRLKLLRASKTKNMGFDFHFASPWLRFDVSH